MLAEVRHTTADIKPPSMLEPVITPNNFGNCESLKNQNILKLTTKTIMQPLQT